MERGWKIIWQNIRVCLERLKQIPQKITFSLLFEIKLVCKLNDVEKRPSGSFVCAPSVDKGQTNNKLDGRKEKSKGQEKKNCMQTRHWNKLTKNMKKRLEMLTKWMMPAAVSQTEMKMEMSWASLSKRSHVRNCVPTGSLWHHSASESTALWCLFMIWRGASTMIRPPAT